MTADVDMMVCPTDETLAAFIDGRLTGEERQRVVDHLAECALCRDVVLLAEDVRVAEGGDSSNVVRPKFGSRWIAPAAAVAASLLVVVVLSRERIENQMNGGMSDVLATYEATEQRRIETRLTELPYKPLKPTFRAGEEEVSQDLVQLQTEYQKQAASGATSWKEYRALAAAALLAGERDEAVAAIDKAAQLAPNEPAVLNDRAATYIERARWSKTPANVQRAQEVTEHAWRATKSLESAWNRAVALGIPMNRQAEAIRAWEEYLKLDDSSEWAAEARENIEDLKADLEL